MKSLFAILFAFLLPLATLAQVNDNSDKSKAGTLTGSFQSDFQYYRKDTVIDAALPDEKIGSNSYLTLMYQKGNFRGGVRYEAYYPALLGFPLNLTGHGIVNRFLTYQNDLIEVTAGHFYEQFGNGLVLRALEERPLGIDNAIDGARAKLNLKDKVRITALVGNQRDGFEKALGTVRGASAEFALDKILKRKEGATGALNLSLNYVNKFQPYDGVLDNVPKNSEAYSVRLLASKGRFGINAEYVRKQKDPSKVNQYSFAGGDMAYVNLSYNQKGLGINVSAQSLHNMNFRSDRDAIDNRTIINFVTSNTKQQTYRLLTLYPYTTQINGEVAYQMDLLYTIKKGSLLGGKYGTKIAFNASVCYELDTTGIYLRPQQSEIFKMGDKNYYQDFNLEINKKWSPKLKTILYLVHLRYDKDQIEGRRGFGVVTSNTIVLENTIKLAKKRSLRIELQHLSTKTDFGNWGMALAELGLGGKWFLYASDEVNYVSFDTNKKARHFYAGGLVYVRGGTRLALNYARQREGLVCVGGICRLVPASNGFGMSINTTF